ncbi:zinc-dependent metalloprotease [Flavobacterium bizetiae]|uniref:zinc-dependent metalloprotease n=1 Tax=Flavobacterium bizetiae TaxID=2704140 RepID=UPI0021E82DC0|nr:zinc-dependent metalloprotease [Flavobacterium bizetiae]UTN02799.1 zinc-dependent metalloprotease [Flavobacterium bizetiae]
MNNSSFNPLIATNNNANAINFYLVNSSSNWAGKAEKILSKNLVLVNSYGLTGVASHELGHCLNLIHTFKGTAAGTDGCAEFINGSNCTSCGDEVCDTPADAGTGNTGGYNPDMTNNMSYYPSYTLDHFTPQQGLRMRNALNSSPLLQTVLSASCANLAGAGNICAENSAQYNLINPQNSPVSWSVSSNLQIISSSNYAITVQAINTAVNGKETVTATLNGMTLQKGIWIGKPKITVYQPPTSSCNSILQIVSAAYDATLEEQGVTAYSWVRGGQTVGEHYNFNFAGSNSPILVSASNSCGARVLDSYVPLKLPVKCGADPLRTANPNAGKFFTVYPNPAKDIVNIELRDQDNQILQENGIAAELFDLNAQSKSKVKITDNKTVLSVSGLTKGVYVLKIVANGIDESHQIIVE